jgi:hypothetical protein
MNTTSAVTTITNELRAVQTILLAGVTAGLLDITAAFVTWRIKGVTPIRVLQGIASGILGPRSFHGGLKTAVLGAALHFVIAFSAAGVFYAASLGFIFITRHWILSGAVYGIGVYAFMYWLILPISAVNRRPPSLTATVVAIITHIACVGLPISLIVRSSSR